MIVSPGILAIYPLSLRQKKLAFRYGVKWSWRYYDPCPVVAITGTNGKTTTTTLAGEILKAQYTGTAVVGNIGVPYSSMVEKLTKKDWVVAEISSFHMEKAETFHPKISAVLNISPDHLNRHKTMETYIP